ncbi:MAG: transposase [Acidobacteria bacterium]|nr:transposase [Acidobacteriota bacterium]
MSRFLAYNPEQAYLLPPSVQEELGAEHLCFFLHPVVERLDLSGFEQEYSPEGGALYHPALMLKVWLYAYALGITSARRLEQRIREDLALRYLAGGARPDNWALSAFRRRHGRTLNDAFTQILEMARSLGMGKLGTVAVDSSRIRAAASRDRIDTEVRLRKERARLRRQVRSWQRQCDRDEGDEGAGTSVPGAVREALAKRLASIPGRLQKLRKSGVAKLPRTDSEARLLHTREGFVAGYTAEIAVSEDHLIVTQRVTQSAHDAHSLVSLVDEVQRQCRGKPRRVLADAGFYSNANLEQLAERGVEAFVPDPNLARWLNRGEPVRDPWPPPTHPRLWAMRRKLRRPRGRKIYLRRKAIVEPVFGVLKQQRGMRQFRTRGLGRVGAEFTLACLAYNLTRLYARSSR